jgi:hypothetical protein
VRSAHFWHNGSPPCPGAVPNPHIVGVVAVVVVVVNEGAGQRGVERGDLGHRTQSLPEVSKPAVKLLAGRPWDWSPLVLVQGAGLNFNEPVEEGNGNIFIRHRSRTDAPGERWKALPIEEGPSRFPGVEHSPR